MEYREAVNYILEIPKFTKKNKPEHTKAFLSYLGNPERNLKVIHVAERTGKARCVLIWMRCSVRRGREWDCSPLPIL